MALDNYQRGKNASLIWRTTPIIRLYSYTQCHLNLQGASFVLHFHILENFPDVSPYRSKFFDGFHVVYPAAVKSWTKRLHLWISDAPPLEWPHSTPSLLIKGSCPTIAIACIGYQRTPACGRIFAHRSPSFAVHFCHTGRAPRIVIVCNTNAATIPNPPQCPRVFSLGPSRTPRIALREGSTKLTILRCLPPAMIRAQCPPTSNTSLRTERTEDSTFVT